MGLTARALRRAAVVAVLTLVVGVASFVFLSSDRDAVQRPGWVAGLDREQLHSDYCITCHQEAGAAWLDSHHRQANAALDGPQPLAGFAGQTATTHAAEYAFARSADGGLRIIERRANGAEINHKPVMRLAYDPLQQFVIETEPGRYQVTEVAWDPQRNEWFAVFGDEERNPGEWGHWTGQAMNWNSMCARCHMTGYDEGYDPAADAFDSTWLEHGIGCVQCHGPMTGHEKNGSLVIEPPEPTEAEKRIAMETCVSCHSRSEALTASFPPGERFADHFRLQLMEDGRLYYPDGQIRDEVFVWGSFRHSRMGAAGVTCFDCHNAHSGELTLSVENNSLCLQCHQAGARADAPAIDPTAHSFHPAASTGNRCVECHMPETTYMQRDPRRDHGFVIPDPVLSRELGVPNACNTCHADQSIDWTIGAWERWYGGEEVHAARRSRARVMARGFDGDASAVTDLVAHVRDEPNAAWRASMLSLSNHLAPGNSALLNLARDVRADPDPLVRAAAVRILGDDGGSRSLVREALRDRVRLVRLDAAWALSPELTEDSTERAELVAYIQNSLEQPVGRMRHAQDLFRRGQAEQAVTEMRKAMALDPLASAFPENLGFMFNAMGRPADAAAEFERAAELAPDDGNLPFYAALAWADAGNLMRTEAQLREAVRREPGLARAWYNLGLLLHQSGRTSAGLTALMTAESADDRDPAVPYAIATIHVQQGRTTAALAALRRVLALDPEHQSARQLLQTLDAN